MKNQLQCVLYRKLTFKLCRHIQNVATSNAKIHFSIDNAIKIKPDIDTLVLKMILKQNQRLNNYTDKLSISQYVYIPY